MSLFKGFSIKADYNCIIHLQLFFFTYLNTTYIYTTYFYGNK